VNTEGRLTELYAAVNQLGESRPGWKSARAGHHARQAGTGYDSTSTKCAPTAARRDVSSLLCERDAGRAEPGSFDPPGIQRIAECRSTSRIRWCGARALRRPRTRSRPGVDERETDGAARVSAGQPVLVEGAARLPGPSTTGCRRVRAHRCGHPSTAQLGPMFASFR